MALFIVLPALNEENALRQLIPDIMQTLKPAGTAFTICVVDDGSRDGTAAWIASSPDRGVVHTIKHTVNQGYGASIRSGVLWVLGRAQSEDVLITMDADNTQPPAYILAIVKKLNEGFGVVTASYKMPGGVSHQVPFKRRVLSWGANTLFRLRFRFPGVATYTNGFRGYKVADLQKAHGRFKDDLIRETNFAGGTELFLNTIRAGARPGEVPFELKYDRRGSESKIRIGRTIRGYLKLLAC